MRDGLVAYTARYLRIMPTTDMGLLMLGMTDHVALTRFVGLVTTLSNTLSCK